jgi:kynurenine 3-monooxygenase
MPIDKHTPITIVGAGLVGSLLTVYLASRGYKVHLYERRSDPRQKRALGMVGEGRSINLAISARGLSALHKMNLKEQVLSHAIPMHGRLMHGKDGILTYQAYGADDSQSINSISRGWLNCFLLDEAEKLAHVDIHFNHRLSSVDLTKKCAMVIDTTAHKERQIFFDLLIGTDGSASAARDVLKEKGIIQESTEELSHGYKEFVMEAAEHGKFKMEKNALHIWPRGPFMMIALPNNDGSYTCTLFLSHKPSTNSLCSFEELRTDEEIEQFFKLYFPDFCEMVPDFLEQYHDHPTGKMVTVKCSPWGHKSVQLMGDASHAIVPFFGQGMNAGFEDVEVFSNLLDSFEEGETLFNHFFQLRKKNADAIADMAVENFVEMSAKTADEKFLYQKKVEKILHEKFPEDYISRYALVSFSTTPYKVAYQVGQKQELILNELTKRYFPSLDIDMDFAHELIKEHLAELKKEIFTH